MGIAFVILWVTAGFMYTARRFLLKGKPLRKHGKIIITYVASLLAWALLTSLIAARKGYVATTEYFGMDVATFVPLVITACFLINRSGRQAFESWITTISLRELTWIHLVRLAATGTIIKMLRGTLPGHFIVPVGTPDFLFALSVPLIDWWIFRRRIIGNKVLIVWNAIGAALFFPTLVLLYLSVPSPIRVFFDEPNTFEVFRFPMALVPTFLAPVFIIIHSAAIVKLIHGIEWREH